MEHRASMVARPDVCVTANVERGIFFRADAESIEIRVADKRWSLPAGINGSVGLSVGDWKGSFDILSNTADMIIAEIDQADIVLMFAAMDKNSSMSVAVGKAKPFSVSLVSSTKATRTCVGFKSNSPTPGSNPFQ
jgi:hypothetical protein